MEQGGAQTHELKKKQKDKYAHGLTSKKWQRNTVEKKKQKENTKKRKEKFSTPNKKLLHHNYWQKNYEI